MNCALRRLARGYEQAARVVNAERALLQKNASPREEIVIAERRRGERKEKRVKSPSVRGISPAARTT